MRSRPDTMGPAAAFAALLTLVSVSAATNQTRSAADEGSTNKTQDASSIDDLEELSPRMMVDMEHEIDEYVPDDQVVGLPGPLYYRQAYPMYSSSRRLLGPRRHIHAQSPHGLLEAAIVLPGAAPLSFGAGAPLMVEVPPLASRSPKGESGHLVTKLAMAAALRDNLVTVLGYLLHQPRWPTSRDHYTALMLLFQAIRLRHVSVLDLLLVLKKASAETPSSQMLLFLRQLRRSAPRYLTSAIEEVISSVSSNRRTVDGIFQPDGGPLVVDFLAGIDSKYLPAAERPISMGKARIDAQVLALMGSTFAQIFSALWDGSLPLSQPLFGALLLHLPLSTLDPRSDELSRMLVDILQRDAYENWRAVTASVKPINKVQPFPLARRILKAMAKHSKTNDDIRDATLVVLHHLQEPERTFINPHYSVLSPIVSKPNIDLVTLLQSITEPEYSEDVVDVKNRIVYYIQHGYLNLDLVTQGFMRYDHVKPIDLVIALLTRINTKMPTLPPEILKSVKSLIIHLAFKELSCNMAPSVPQNFVHLPSLITAFLSPSLPEDIQQMSEKALKIIIHEYPDDINKLLPDIPVKQCIRPRKCLGTIMRKALELRLLKGKPTLSSTEEFLEAIEQFDDNGRRKVLKVTTTAFHSSPDKQHLGNSQPSLFSIVQKLDASTTPKTTDSSLTTLVMNTPSMQTPSLHLVPSLSVSLSEIKPTGGTIKTSTGKGKSPMELMPTATLVTVSNEYSRGHITQTAPGSTSLLPSSNLHVLSDISTQSVHENKIPKLTMGSDGKPVFPKGPTGKPMYPIGPEGKPVIFINTQGRPIFPTGPDGNPIHPTGTDGKTVFVTGLDGKVVIPFTSDGRPIYPETLDKIPIIPTADDGNPVFPTTPIGAPILPVRPDGNPIFPVSSDGRPIAPTGSDGKPLFMVGLDGKLVLRLGIDNAPIIPKGPNGAPLFILGPQPVLGIVLGVDGNPYSTGMPETIYTITPNLELTNGLRETVACDISTQSVTENKLPKIEMGTDKKPVFPKGPTGKPMYPAGLDGKPVVFIGKDNKPIFPTGPDGNPIHPTGTDGKPVFVTGLDGKVIIPFTANGRPVYPETPDKKPIVPTATDGNPIFPTTATGALILPVRPDGNPIFPVNSDGMPIAPRGSDGKPVFTASPDGKLFLKLGINNVPIIPKGPDGAPVFILGPQPVLGILLGPDGNPYSTGMNGTFYTIKPNLEHAIEVKETVVSDIYTQSVSENKLPKIEMGLDGKPVFPKGPSGKPMYPIGPQGKPVIFIGKDGKPIFPKGPDGNPIHATGTDGRPVFVTGIDGKVVIPFTSDGRPVYPETLDKKPIVPTAPDGNPIFPTTSTGALILPVGPNGKPILPVNSHGTPIAPTGSDGKPLFTVGPDGKLFLKLGINNVPIIPKGPDGAPVFILGPQPVLGIVLGPDGNPYSTGMLGTLYTITPNLQHTIELKETVVSDISTQSVSENKLPKIEIGADHKPVFPKGPTGKPMYPIGPEGKPIIFIDTGGKPIFPTGPDGNPIHPTGTDGRPVFVTGIDGKVVIPFTSDGRPVYPETLDKKPIVPTAPDGNPIFPTTSTGVPILPVRPDGKPILPVNSHGKPIAPTGSDGKPLFTVGPDGKLYLKLGINNVPIIPKGPDGAPVFILGPQPVLGIVLGPDGNPYSTGMLGTIYTVTPNLQHTIELKETIVSDISTQSVSENNLPKIEVDADGKPVFPKRPTGEPMYPIGPEGKPIIFIGTDGKPIFPTGPDGNPIHPTGTDGKPVFVTGLDGKVVIPFTSDGRPVYPETPDKKPIVPTGPDGNPIFPTAPNGAPILPVRLDGEPILPVSSDGMLIVPTGSDGEPLFTTGPDGRLFLKFGMDNAAIIPKGPDGAPLFILGPQPMLAIVLGPDGNPYSIGMPGAIYKTTPDFEYTTEPRETEAGNLVEQPTLASNGKLAFTKAPVSPTLPSLETLLASHHIQSLIPQVPKDVPLPELNPVDEQLPIIPDVTLDYLLPPTLPGTPEDLRLRPLRALLAMPEFTKLITAGMDLTKYKTRGELLRAVILYLLKMEELKNVQLFLDDLQFYLKRLQGADGKAPRLEVNWEGLLSALPIPSTTEEAMHYKKIKEFLGPGLTQKLGTGFDSKAFKLKGALLKNLLQYVISLHFVMEISGLSEAIRFYTDKVLMHGYGAQPVEYIIVKQTMMMRTVNLNSLFKALDKSKFDTRARDAYKSMFKFFTTEFDAQKHFTGFDFTRFTSKGPWLKSFLEFLSDSEIVPPTRKEDFKVLTAYVAMDGEGKSPVEYVD